MPRWYASEKGVVYGITCSCNRVKIWKKSSLVGLCMKFYKSSAIFRIQSFKIRPLQNFYKKAPFLTFEDEKTTLEWPKLVSETIFPTDWGYIWSEKSGFRFSFGALRVPEPKDQIQRLQLQNLDQSPASKFLSKLHFQRQYHSSIMWVNLYWNENDPTLVQ